MSKVFDVRHAYRGIDDCACICRIRGWEPTSASNGQPIVVLTELRENHGTSITNWIEHLLGPAREYLPNDLRKHEPIYVEPYPEGLGLTSGADQFNLVRLEKSWLGKGEPAWDGISHERVDELIGEHFPDEVVPDND
jgi:hypothetical protein